MKDTYCGIKGFGKFALDGTGAGLAGGLGLVSNLDLMLLYVFDKDVAVLNAEIKFDGFKFIDIVG